MKIAIITSVSGKSSKRLAEHLKLNGIEAEVFQPYKSGREAFTTYDWVFSYGCSASTIHKKRINSAKAVKICTNKVETFKVFNNHKIPTVRYWTDKGTIPKDVEHIVIRQDRKGKKAEGYDVWNKWEGLAIPDGDLYTEWFTSKRELRVTVFKDEVFVYRKDDDGQNNHEFVLTVSPVYMGIHAHALQAARALGIDYVSFDVLYNDRANYVFLEANSGSILTEELSTAIVEFFLNLE